MAVVRRPPACGIYWIWCSGRSRWRVRWNSADVVPSISEAALVRFANAWLATIANAAVEIAATYVIDAVLTSANLNSVNGLWWLPCARLRQREMIPEPNDGMAPLDTRQRLHEESFVRHAWFLRSNDPLRLETILKAEINDAARESLYWTCRDLALADALVRHRAYFDEEAPN